MKPKWIDDSPGARLGARWRMERSAGRRRPRVLAALCHSCARRAEPPLWRRKEVPIDADFVGAWFSDSLSGWITGSGWAIDGGIVGRTRDGGRSWRFQSGIVLEPGVNGVGGRLRVV
jgi:hypothetical protein